MRKLLDLDILVFLSILLGIGTLIELTFYFQPIIILIFAVGMIYLGVKQSPKTRGTILIILGVFIAFLMVLSSIIFKISLVVVFLLLVFKYLDSKKNPRYQEVETFLSVVKRKVSKKKQSYIKNILIGHQRIVNQVFETDDINIQCGIGETVIDLSMTLLPLGETVVVIRGLIGKIELLVPYDVEVCVNHSVMAGKIRIFDEEDGGFNQNIIYYSDKYGEVSRKIKIITSLVVGDIEVNHI